MMFGRNTQKVVFQLAWGAAVYMLASTATQAAELTLRGDAEVIEDTVYLSDVFDNVPMTEDGILARAPEPGQSQILRIHALIDAVARAEHTWANDERVRRVTITRASYTIEGEEIAALIERALITDGYGNRFDVTLSNRNFALHLPLDVSPEVAVDRLRHDAQTGYFEVTLNVPALTGEAPSLRGRATAVLEIPVLAAQLPINAEITARDIIYIDMAQDRLANGVVTNASELIGMAPRRNVRPGQPVRIADIGAPIIAERGDRIRVAYQVPGMALTVIGEAVEEGSLNDVIRMRNTSTQNIFEARLVGPGRAEAIMPLASQPLTVSMN